MYDVLNKIEMHTSDIKWSCKPLSYLYVYVSGEDKINGDITINNE